MAEQSATRGGSDRPDDAQSVDWLQDLAVDDPDHPSLCYLRGGDGGIERLSAAQWDEQARRIAAWLLQRGRSGDRVLLAHGPGPGFLTGFYACLYAGMIAVPAYPPKRTRHGVRLDSVLRDCGARLALADAAGAAALRKVAGEPGPWSALECLDQDGPLPQALGRESIHRAQPDDVAYLQYTSGSTADPKGVMVTHGSLAHNLGLMRRAFEGGPGMVMVSWLPLFHDMGLVLGALLPLYCRGRCVLMAPNEFVQSPRLWLEALSAHGGTHSAAPDFAYRLCCDKLGPQDLQGLDLRAWRVAVNGAEPVRAVTLDRFSRLLQPQGFKPQAFKPSYGLAEGTLYVSHGTWDGSLEEPVGCGHATGQRLVLVEAGTQRPCHEGQVGEIWVQGPSVCAGYWQRPGLSDAVFKAQIVGLNGSFLRTGDLGRISQGRLQVHGRLKDLIILRGVNHHPEDMEESSRLAVGPGAGAAAAFAVEGGDGERLVLVQELSKDRRDDAAAVAARIAEALAQGHGVQAERIVVVGPAQVPRTSSGKVQRRACRQDYLAGALRVWHEQGASRHPDAAVAPMDSLRQAEQCALEARLRAQAASQSIGGGSAPTAPASPQDWVPGVARAVPVTGVQTGPVAAQAVAGPAQAFWRERAHPALASLWTAIAQMEDSSAYHIAWSLRFERPLDLDRLRSDLAAVVREQPLMGAAFQLDPDGQLWAEAQGAVPELEQPFAGSPQAWGQARAWLQAWNGKPMDTAQAPLWRAAAIPLDDGGMVLGFCVQHLIFDQRSWAAFHERLQGAPALSEPLAPLSIPAAPPAEREASRRHWRQALSHARIPRLLPRPSGQGARCTAEVPGDVVAGVLKVAALNRVTPFTALAAAWGDALARFSQAEQALLAVPMTLREQPLSDPRLGYYVQPMPLLVGRCGSDPGKALAQAAQALQDASRHRAVTLGEALRLGALAGPEAFLVVQGGLGPEPRVQGQAAQLEALDSGALKAPLALEISGEERWSLALSYDRALGEPQARRLLGLFSERLELWAQGQAAAAERPALLRCEAALPDPCRTVVDGFHRQVGIRAQAPALAWQGGQLSYGDLAEKVRSVARALDQAGIIAGQRVAVLASPGPDWVAAVLGCFEAGAVYVPMDPAYPPERHRAMLQAAPCVLALVEGQPPASMAGMPVLDLNAAVHARPPYLRPPGRPAPSEAAYVIFTSGSSGRPKGVQVGHGALLNHALSYAKRLGLTPQDRVLQFVSISFDPSLEELLPTLLSGGTVVLSRRSGALAPQELEVLAREQRVSVLHLPAAYWHAWMASGGGEAVQGLPALRALVAGGEAPDPDAVERLLRAGQGRCRFFNAYGPTEACISVSLFECCDASAVPRPLPLGRPLAGMGLAVVTAQGRLASGEEEGELWISGPQLADHHWIDGGKDETAFSWAAFEGVQPQRWYRSGDLVQWRAGQGLIHRGRLDRQLKVAGHRLDPEELEQLLLKAPDVAQAAVDARMGATGELELLAWVVPAAGATPDLEALRGHLAERLPAACRPRRVLALPALPLTPNGKLDRRALLQGLERALPEASPGAEGPLNALAQAWSRCLGQAGLGADADFFEHGGSSLTAVRLASEASRICGRPVSVDQLMRCGSPRRLWQELGKGSPGAAQADEPLRLLAGQGAAQWVLFPPVSGRLDCYRELSQALGQGARVFGLDLAALGEGLAWGQWVERCATLIREALPAGPLALGGWSMGGLLAADVACSLQAQGRPVQRLVLIDSLVPDPVESALLRDDPSVLDAVFERDLGALGGGGPAGEGAGPTAPWRQRFKEHALALSHYLPRPLPMPVTLAVSERSARERAQSSWMAWALLAHAGMTTLLLPGDHYALLNGNAGLRLARRMDRDAWGSGDASAALAVAHREGRP
jgi:amino acid adenylation domain-containing protein